MPERRSPLAAVLKPCSHGRGGAKEIGVTIQERRLASLAQVAGWPSAQAALAARLQVLTGIAPPPPGRSASNPDVTVLAIAPGRWLIAAGGRPDLAAKLMTSIDGDAGTVSDLGHARSVVRLAGPKVRALLAKGLPIDLHPRAVPAGGVVQGSVHHMGVLVHRQAEPVFDLPVFDPPVFDLYVFRGLAVSLWDWLSDAAAEYGYAIVG